MIEARGLSKRYGATTAVENLSFEVLPGRVTGFLGPDGAVGLGVFFLYAVVALGAAAVTLVRRDA